MMNMDNQYIFAAGSTAACRFAASYLKGIGLPVTESPGPHAHYLLLDTPAFGPGDQLRGGGSLEKLLQPLPKDLLVGGGNLNHPLLEAYKTVDFLRDEIYLCENAYITAECALDVALPYLSRTIRHCPVLIIGWGRIGKCLAGIFRNLEAEVTVAARNPKDRAMIHATGYRSVEPKTLPEELSHFRLLFNTVPAPVLSTEQINLCHDNCVKIDLASSQGLAGDDIIIARGLPGLHMPESSGKLIADTFLRLCYGR